MIHDLFCHVFDGSDFLLQHAQSFLHMTHQMFVVLIVDAGRKNPFVIGGRHNGSNGVEAFMDDVFASLDGGFQLVNVVFDGIDVILAKLDVQFNRIRNQCFDCFVVGGG